MRIAMPHTLLLLYSEGAYLCPHPAEEVALASQQHPQLWAFWPPAHLVHYPPLACQLYCRYHPRPPLIQCSGHRLPQTLLPFCAAAQWPQTQPASLCAPGSSPEWQHTASARAVISRAEYIIIWNPGLTTSLASVLHARASYMGHSQHNGSRLYMGPNRHAGKFHNP